MIWQIALFVFVTGCIGGVVNAFLDDEFRLPYIKDECRLWDPGVLGNIIVGGVAALVFWGLSSNFSDEVLFPANVAGATTGHTVFTVGHLISSLLVGAGGGRILTAELDRICLKKIVGNSDPT